VQSASNIASRAVRSSSGRESRGHHVCTFFKTCPASFSFRGLGGFARYNPLKNRFNVPLSVRSVETISETADLALFTNL